jgi:hypothetical protein
MAATDNYWLIRRHPEGGYAVTGVMQRVNDAYKDLFDGTQTSKGTPPADVAVVHLNEDDDPFDVQVPDGAKRFTQLDEDEDWAEANSGFFDYWERHPECNVNLDLVGEVQELWGGGEMEWTGDADPYTYRQIAIHRKNGVEYRCGCDTYEPCYCYEAALEGELAKLRGLVSDFLAALDETPGDATRAANAKAALARAASTFPAPNTTGAGEGEQ